MTQPEALSKNEPLFWSTGKGTDVWDMFCAAMTGDLQTIKSLLSKNPYLIRINIITAIPCLLQFVKTS